MRDDGEIDKSIREGEKTWGLERPTEDEDNPETEEDEEEEDDDDDDDDEF